MADPDCKGSGGFTYLAALFMVVVMGIMLGMIGQSWSAIMKREREEELLFRGTQIKNAIDNWYKKAQGRHALTSLKELKDLLKDPRSLQTIRYLRQLYTDPLTGEEWKVINGPVKGEAFTGIVGVHSTSDAEPLKQAGFPDEYKHFEGKKKYSEWAFLSEKAAQQPTDKPEALKMPDPFLKDAWDKTNPTTR
jgi:type II secretory pathway pseudopilin PulG